MIDEPVADVLERLRGLDAEAILADAAARYPGRVALASLLGAEDQVLTHMIAEAGLDIPIFVLDTGRLFPETHDLLDRTCARYGVAITVYCPDAAEVERMVAANGINLFRESRFLREQCCETRKTRPLRRAQVGLDAWICGRRGGGGAPAARVSADGGAAMGGGGTTQAVVEPAEWDAAAGLLRLNPLAAWDEARVWAYVRAHDVPYNPLHDRGLATIDCAPCTSACGGPTDPDQTRYP